MGAERAFCPRVQAASKPLVVVSGRMRGWGRKGGGSELVIVGGEEGGKGMKHLEVYIDAFPGDLMEVVGWETNKTEMSVSFSGAEGTEEG